MSRKDEEWMRRHTRTDRPLGDSSFLDGLKRLIGRIPHPQAQTKGAKVTIPDIDRQGTVWVALVTVEPTKRAVGAFSWRAAEGIFEISAPSLQSATAIMESTLGDLGLDVIRLRSICDLATIASADMPCLSFRRCRSEIEWQEHSKNVRYTLEPFLFHGKPPTIEIAYKWLSELAAKEADAEGESIGPEHYLLAVLSLEPESTEIRWLKAIGVDLRLLREDLESTVSVMRRERKADNKFRSVNKLLDAAVSIAAEMREPSCLSLHLLLALMQSESGIGGGFFRRYHIDYENAKAAAVRLLEMPT